MSVGELRAVIEGAGMSHEDILDKQELRRRALAALKTSLHDDAAADNDHEMLKIEDADVLCDDEVKISLLAFDTASEAEQAPAMVTEPGSRLARRVAAWSLMMAALIGAGAFLTQKQSPPKPEEVIPSTVAARVEGGHSITPVLVAQMSYDHYHRGDEEQGGHLLQPEVEHNKLADLEYKQEASVPVDTAQSPPLPNLPNPSALRMWGVTLTSPQRPSSLPHSPPSAPLAVPMPAEPQPNPNAPVATPPPLAPPSWPSSHGLASDNCPQRQMLGRTAEYAEATRRARWAAVLHNRSKGLTAPALSFYVYAAQRDDENDLENAVAGNLPGVLLFLHTEVAAAFKCCAPTC